MKKKIMALLLAVIMICTMASATTAWAAESDDITSWILEEDTSIAGRSVSGCPSRASRE